MGAIVAQSGSDRRLRGKSRLDGRSPNHNTHYLMTGAGKAMIPHRTIAVAILLLLAGQATGRAEQLWPPPSLDLTLAAPIMSWDEAIPLGNGLTGGLLWGEKNVVRLSLDRGDLWDERPAAGKDWWKQRTWARGGDWDGPYGGATPTKLPAGRIEIALPPTDTLEKFDLRLAEARGAARLSSGRSVEVFFSAVEPIALVRIPGSPQAIDLTPSGSGKERGNAGPSSGGAVSALGYSPAARGRAGQASWFVQDAAEGFKYCVCLETRLVGSDTLMAVAITTNRDAADLLALARQRSTAALDQGYEATLRRHVDWWRAFWAQSSVDLPQADILRYYAFARYLYGAGSRRGAPPMPLQGVWTADNGGLPPWKGDYHNDLNTQMTYIAYHGAGNFDEGACYLDFLSKLTPTFTEFARDFYGTPGLASPGVMSLAGQPLGGWGQYSLSPTMTSWNAHLFYLHWRYTMDDTFLRQQAYPWCKAAGQCIRGLLKPDDKARLKLFRSSSPEIFDNSPRAWLIPNSNYDLFCMKMHFLALAEMADALGERDEQKQWRETAEALGDFHADAAGTLLVDAKTPLPYSHRHLSNIMGIFPFNLITCEGDEKDRRRIKASLAQWDKLGTGGWCGYSFAWMAGLRARTGDAEAAMRHLDIFVHAFTLRNGFHANGDQTGSGFSNFTYRPFTLEGNFAALQAIHEMLLQSWSPTPGRRDTEIIRIFPATPWRWHDAAFADLRTEGAHRVSAKRENNATTWLRIVAGKDGEVRVRDNFEGRTPKWNKPVTMVGNHFVATLRKGEILEATLANPSGIPPSPADLAEPFVLKAANGISVNQLPLRIGAASDGSNRFKGDIARVVVAGNALSPVEIASLADPRIVQGEVPITIVDKPQSLQGLTDNAYRLNGNGYLEIPSLAAPSGEKGLTLAAWIRPAEFPAAGMRIIDKCPVAAARGYLLDTYPGDSLRLITREPHFVFPAKLPVGQWTHVAATVDGITGKQILYVNGKAVASH